MAKQTTQQLIEKLQSFPSDTVLTIRDVTAVEYFIHGFDHGANGLTIVINEDEEDEQESEED